MRRAYHVHLGQEASQALLERLITASLHQNILIRMHYIPDSSNASKTSKFSF
nr:MAG TPA: hypothetical protein [Caudoviricetes sp.]